MHSLSEHIARHARSKPDAHAYLGAGAPLSWAEYDRAADALAHLLVDVLGLARGERLALLLPDGPGVHVGFVAAERAGLIGVGIGPRAGLREIEHLLRKTDARAFLSASAQQSEDLLGAVVRWTEAGLGVDHHLITNQELREGAEIRILGTPHRLSPSPQKLPSARGFAPDELSFLNSTSGTTGMPKCVTHDLARWIAFHELAVERGELSDRDVFMSVVPAPFGFGIWTSHVTPTLLGVPTVVMSRFDPDEALDAIERHRVTVLAAVSTQFIMMLEANDARPRDLSSLRVLFTGGEAVPYARAAAFEEATGAAVLQFYGSNETGAVSGTATTDSRDKRLRTAGRPIPEMNLRLFDDAGNDVTKSGAGQPGCKGPTLSRGYYGPGTEVANRELIREDGWMLLGDRVTLDADGYLTVVGRIDDFIIRGGKNISGPGVEEQVATHPAVSLAAAVAMPDPVFGERVCVFVELRPGAGALDLEDLRAHLASRNVSKETWPERIEVVDALPRGSGGKVAKQALRETIRAKLEAEGALGPA